MSARWGRSPSHPDDRETGDALHAWSGTFSSGLALQLLLIGTLSADQAAIGLVRSAQRAPAPAIGMLAGVLTDRVRRRPVLVAADTVTALATGGSQRSR